MWYKYLLTGIILLIILYPLGACKEATREDVPPSYSGIKVEKWASTDEFSTWEDFVTQDNCDVVGFYIEVTNEGNTGLTDIVITDMLPDNMEYVDDPQPYAFPDTDVTSTSLPGTRTPTWLCPSLNSGDMIMIWYYVRISCPENYVNVTLAKAKGHNMNVIADSDTAVVEYNGCTDAPSGIVAWWTMDELENGVLIRDRIGNNHGMPAGPPAEVPAYICDGREFNGVSDYIEVLDNDPLDFNTGNFSFDAWIKTADDTGVSVIIDKRTAPASHISPYDITHSPKSDASSPDLLHTKPLPVYPISGYIGYTVFLYNGFLGLQLADGNHVNYISQLFVADDSWNHIAITVDRNSSQGIIFYLNGQSDGYPQDPTSCGGSISNDSPLRIGCRSFDFTGKFSGVLDEVELFNVALQQPMINDIYNCGKCR